MRIIDKETDNIKGQKMHVFTIYADLGEDFKEQQYFYANGKRFKIFTSEKFDDRVDIIPTYEVYAVYKPQPTKFNYDNTNWFNVFSLERINTTQIEVKSHLMTSIITLENPKECLQEYLQLLQLLREGGSSDEFAELR